MQTYPNAFRFRLACSDLHSSRVSFAEAQRVRRALLGDQQNYRSAHRAGVIQSEPRELEASRSCSVSLPSPKLHPSRRTCPPDPGDPPRLCPAREWPSRHGRNAVPESQDAAQEEPVPAGGHRLRGRVRLQGARVALPQLQPEAGADAHAGGADGARAAGVQPQPAGAAAVRLKPHRRQGLVPSALRRLRLALHRHQRQVPAGEPAAADRSPEPALLLQLLAAVLPVPARVRGSGARRVAAAAADVRGVRAAAGAHAARAAVRCAGVPGARHRHGDVGDGEDAAAVESGEFSAGRAVTHERHTCDSGAQKQS